MKRQAEGLRLSDDIEETEENGNKRMKLLNNDTMKENIQVDHVKEKSVMDISANENFDDNNYEDEGPSISNNVSALKRESISSEKKDSESSSNQIVHETESSYIQLSNITNNCNGSCDKDIEGSVSDSVDVHHLSYSEENSLQCSEGNPISHSADYVEKSLECPEESAMPTLNHFDDDLHGSESTDSFQSNNFDAQNAKENSENGIIEKPKDDASCKVSEEQMGKSSHEVSEKHKAELNYEVLKKHSSQDQDNFKNEFSLESDSKKDIDADNLTLSSFKVSELLGHTEEVLSVAADEDFILSCGADTTTKVWNMERQNIISTFSGHSNSVTSVLLLNPNQSKKIKKKMSLTKVSRIAITGSLDCHIKLWSVLEGKELASVYTFNGITCLGYLESECLVVVGTEGGKLELWNLSQKKAVISEKAHENKVTDIKVIDNYIYSVSLDGTTKVWSYEDEDISPVYSRIRKEKSPNKSEFNPAQWKSVAISGNIMYLGDNSSNIKVLDWRAGRLSLFKNQMETRGICNCVVAEGNVLFSSCYDTFTGTSGINVWKLPEMTYTCTLVGIFPKINNLAVVQKDNKLRIITGGDKLFICEFDYSKPPSYEGDFYVREYERLGQEINENPVEIKKAENNTSRSEVENHSTNKWCNIM